MAPLKNLNECSQFSTFPYMRITLTPIPILSNEVSMEPITYHQQFHKGKEEPSIKFSFYPARGHLKLVRVGTEL